MFTGFLLLLLLPIVFIILLIKLKVKQRVRSWAYISIICFFGFLLVFGVNEFLRRKIGGFAGSYAFAETWEIQASEQEVIDAIKELNKTNQNFQPPKDFELISERDTGYIWTSNEMISYLEKLKTDSLTPLPEKNYQNYYYDYWLFIHLYYPESKEVVYTWTRPGEFPKVTTFAFICLDRIDNPSQERYINRDFWFIPNQIQIHKFKRTFVDKIKEQIKKNREKTS